ncbi:hypothetical protein [Phaeovulum sp. NW3]|uniref:hypothetical protein n=1 Tax=Phaeovulum sp. NW3 TaxID=2934933 RepID=UPI00201FC505|nr:hypothetical protein [Phaeovulum sp. NW3]MCL7463896.1 hypothetical protein [Phaeovulum sp. NW3]
MRRGAQLWRRHRLAILGFGLALALVVVFAVRLTVAAFYWSDPAHRRIPPEGWMTMGYLARSWQLDPAELAAHLGLEPGSARGLTLAELARARAIPEDRLLADLAAALPDLVKAP